MVKIILSLDIGSSSIRCSPYRLQSSLSSSLNKLDSMQECSASKKISSVRPNSGKIILFPNRKEEEEEDKDTKKPISSLFDEIDSCIDKVIVNLRSKLNCKENNAAPHQIVNGDHDEKTLDHDEKAFDHDEQPLDHDEKAFDHEEKALDQQKNIRSC